MNVLLISPLPPPAGGIASWTERYMESKQAKNNNILIVNTSLIGKRVKEYKKRYFYDELKRSYEILSDLKKQMNQNQIDVVHLNCSCGRFGSLIRDYLCALTVKRKRVKLITHFHCDVSYMVDSKTDLFFFKKLVKITDLVLTLNENSKKFTYHNCSKKSIHMPNFLSEEYMNSISDDQEIKENLNIVLYVGYVKESKGCDVIYETARRFPGLQFILLGSIGENFKKIPKPSNINLLGEVSREQVKAEMLKADLLLFPTHTEGFPNVVLEAMACKMPVISTPVGAIPDMIEKSGGILVPVNDVNAAVEAISALESKDLRKQMATWNRQKVKNYYTADTVMNQLFEIYQGEGR